MMKRLTTATLLLVALPLSPPHNGVEETANATNLTDGRTSAASRASDSSRGPRLDPIGDELLEPDKAFALKTRVVDGNTLEASWKIAPGYYLYRNKFKFESLDGTVALKPAVLPAGKVKDDQFFGRTEIYTKSVSVRMPLERRPDGRHEAKLKITAQGCNEPVGVCYPPITKEIRFKLPALVAKASAAESKVGQITSLKDLAK